MSSHFHRAVVSVEDQRISELFCLFDALLAKSVNASEGAARVDRRWASWGSWSARR
ncbi:MAG: hypothetical protein R3B82_26025 [Sandaracinaceae bacterium]